MTENTFHVYGGRAYRSEIALYRAERVTAAEAVQIAAPASVACLWRAECATGPDLITHDASAALRAFTARSAHLLQSIEIAG